MSDLNDDIDLVFLTEVRDRLTRARTDVSELEMVETMVDDWIHQLTARAAQPAEDATAALAGEVFDIVRAVEQQQTAARKPWGWALIQSPLTATVCIGEQCPSNLHGLPNVRAVYVDGRACDPVQVEAGPHLCIHPHCPLDCSMCNHAVAADDKPRQIIVKLLWEFAKDGHGGEFEDCEHPLVDQARKFLHRARSTPSGVR